MPSLYYGRALPSLGGFGGRPPNRAGPMNARRSRPIGTASSLLHPLRPPRPSGGDHRPHPTGRGRDGLERGATDYGSVQPAVGRQHGFIDRRNGWPRPTRSPRHDAPALRLAPPRLPVRVDDSRCGYPAGEHPCRGGQPLGVSAHDDDFDGAACCQQRRLQPGMLPAPGPQVTLRLLFR